MKESYQREEYCSDQRKGSLRHFSTSEELGVKLQGREAPRVVIRSQFIGLLTKTDGMSSAWRRAPQRSMKTGSVGSMLCEACGPEVFDLTGA